MALLKAEGRATHSVAGGCCSEGMGRDWHEGHTHVLSEMMATRQMNYGLYMDFDQESIRIHSFTADCYDGSIDLLHKR